MIFSPFKHLLAATLLAGASSLPLMAAPASDTANIDAVRTYRAEHEGQIMADSRNLLSLPNVATNRGDMLRNAAWISAYMAKRGFKSETVSAGGSPYILAERKTPGATKTILIYAHYDGQPVVPADWASPPFTPSLRDGLVEEGGKAIDWPQNGHFNPEWRLFARAAGDDKAPIITLMAAIDALQETGQTISANIKLILDGEEEQGSPSLPSVLAKYGDRLKADLMLFCDGPMHQSGRRMLVFGARGDMGVDITTYGAIRPLHSGHYGNWAPNPADRLMRLLTAMKDADGNITVPGYTEPVRPASSAEEAAVEALPNMGEKLQKELALGSVDGGGARLASLIMKPAIVVRGMKSGEIGDKARNVIPTTATASLDLRLVPNQTPESARTSLTAFFKAQGYTLTEADPGPELLSAPPKVLKVDWKDGAYPAFRSQLDSPAAIKLKSILDSIDGNDTLMAPTMGGSLPIYLFKDVVKAPIVLLPIANHDDNQHGRNENVRIANLWNAIDTYAAVLVSFGR